MKAAPKRDTETAPPTRKSVSARLFEAEDNERRRLSRELHDCIAGSLVAIKMSVGKLRSKLGPEESKATEQIESAVDKVIAEIRTMSYLLHPPTLDVIGLKSSIVTYAAEFQRRTGIETSLEAPESLPRLEAATETSLFRIIQECLTNAHKHAKASKILITVAVSGEAIQIGITDNGDGFPEGFREGFGIHGMRERAKELGGTISVESLINIGTSIIVRIPL